MDYDCIVIGSGAGGLTAAVALAQSGKKVLVLEQHDRPGGWTHSFTLEGYRFSPGVHYIGDLQEGGGLRHIYDGLGVSQDLTFCELNPDGYDHIIIGDRRVDFPKGKENLIDRLKSHFPHEARGIDGYFSDMINMIESLSAHRRFEPSIEIRSQRADHPQVDACHRRGPHQRACQRSCSAGRAGWPVWRSWITSFACLGIHACWHYLSLSKWWLLSAWGVILHPARICQGVKSRRG